MIHNEESNGCRVFIADESAHEVVNFCCDHMRDGTFRGRRPAGDPVHRGDWTGRHFDSWEHARSAFAEPLTPAQLELIQDMGDRLKQDLATPQDVRRRAQYSEHDGDVDCDRALRGENEYLRRVTRSRVVAVKTVTLALNVGGHCNVSPDEMFWRGAAAVAAVDLLEAAGYSCEVWAWHTSDGYYDYDYGPRNRFAAVRVKASGDPVDVGAIGGSVTSWFFRTFIMQTGLLYPNVDDCMGHPDSDDYGLLGTRVAPNTQLVRMGYAESQRGAVEAAKAVLEQVSQMSTCT